MQEKVCEIHKSYKIELYFNFPSYRVLITITCERTKKALHRNQKLGNLK